MNSVISKKCGLVPFFYKTNDFSQAAYKIPEFDKSWFEFKIRLYIYVVSSGEKFVAFLYVNDLGAMKYFPSYSKELKCLNLQHSVYIYIYI